MKFAHLADCHIGSWREPELRDLNLKAFRKTIDICIKENVGFILIAGDLFSTALPSIDLLKEVASQLEKLRNQDIAVYVIPGSHDFSPTGRTMLGVLEKAGLCENVFKFENGKLKFTVDKTNTKITGLLGRKGALEKKEYALLDKNSLEKEPGFKIFMFHTALTEFKPKELKKMESQPLSLLPENFNYYAGGHLHYKQSTKKENYGLIVYPGPLFPDNFKEIEDSKHGGFYIVDDKLNLKYVSIKIKEVVSFKINCSDKNPNEVEKEILERINKEDLKDKIVTLRIEGALANGKPSDINFKELTKKIYDKDAYFVMKNTSKLTTKEFEELKVETGSVDDVEESIIKEHLGQIKVKGITKDEEEKFIHNLINTLNIEKNEGEKVSDFENRLVNEIIKVLDLEKIWK